MAEAVALYAGYKGVKVVYKEGMHVYEYFKNIRSPNITMKIEYKRENEEYKFIFTAPKPSMLNTLTFGVEDYETTEEEEPHVFAIIELKCYVQKVAEQMFAHFGQKNKMSQKDIIHYLTNYTNLFKDDYIFKWHGDLIDTRTHMIPTGAPCPGPTFKLYIWKSTYEIHEKR